MRFNLFEIYRRTFALVFLVFILLIVANKTFYTHSHVLDDGTVITHAHPYDKGADNAPLKNHHHTTAELLLFNILNFLPTVAFAFAFAILIKKKPFFHLTNEKSYHSTCWRFILGRAPPALIS